ncbi:MAG TPA: histidine kinase [Microbacterium sp.]|nr:histidine kinase [Microbacterium sp.]
MSAESAVRTPATRIASALLALEALVLVLLTGWQIVEMIAGEATSVTTSTALIVLTLIAAVGVAAFAYAVWTGRSWGRSGGIVAQVLIVAIAIGSVQGGAGHWGIALALAVPAVVTFVALIGSARGAAPRQASED